VSACAVSLRRGSGRGRGRACVALSSVGSPPYAGLMLARFRRGWWWSLAAAASLALASPAAAAAKKAKRPKKTAKAEGPDLSKIGELAQEGQNRFETADYAGAIDMWTQAYSGLPAESAFAVQRGLLVYQIAQACVEAYSIDPDLLYLRKAERLFSTYLETLSEADAATTADVRVTIAELQATIAAAVEAAAAAEAAALEAAAVAATPEEAEEEQEPPPPPPPEPDPKAGRGLMITGGALLGLGAAGLGLMTYSLAWGAKVDTRGEAAVAGGETDPEVFRELLREGTQANRLALISGAAAGVLVITGAALLGAGARARSRGRGAVAWAPMRVRGGAGLMVEARF
jgi:hypothetical protein